MLNLLMRICYYNFGEFNKAEFKKFLLMGCIFALIIGVYWTLKPLKDSIFIQLVDKMHLPFAKTLTVAALLPIVIIFTKLLEHHSREKMLILLPIFNGMLILVFSIFMYIAQGTDNTFLHKTLGYLWYIFVESFGSLMMALFWAFAADTTHSKSAEKGFPLIVAIGQLGGIFLPYNIGGIPHRFGYTSDAISMIILSILIFLIIPIVRYLLNSTPNELLYSNKKMNMIKQKSNNGFFEGIKLIIANKYLLGIFTSIFIYETIITIFDFNFKLEAATQFNGVELTHFLSIYASSINLISLLFLLLGISNISRNFGLGISLCVVPIMFAFGLVVFSENRSLWSLFILMISLKATNYACNIPSLKQLYIPTSSTARFKAQAWIETFGSRLSKETGSLVNMSLTPLRHIFGEIPGKSLYLTGVIVLGIPLLIVWILTSLYLNKCYKTAIKENKLIC